MEKGMEEMEGTREEPEKGWLGWGNKRGDDDRPVLVAGRPLCTAKQGQDLGE
jgi:hypothetical protein